MSDDFASPSASAGLDYEACLGHLLVITVTGYEESIATTLGDKPAIRADVFNVDDPDLSAEDALIFPRVLIASLRPRIGQRVLGVLAQGVAKPGQNAPWILEDAATDPAAVKRAKAALAPAKPAKKATAAAGASPVPF